MHTTLSVIYAAVSSGLLALLYSVNRRSLAVSTGEKLPSIFINFGRFGGAFVGGKELISLYFFGVVMFGGAIGWCIPLMWIDANSLTWIDYGTQYFGTLVWCCIAMQMFGWLHTLIKIGFLLAMMAGVGYFPYKFLRNGVDPHKWNKAESTSFGYTAAVLSFADFMKNRKRADTVKEHPELSPVKTPADIKARARLMGGIWLKDADTINPMPKNHIPQFLYGRRFDEYSGKLYNNTDNGRQQDSGNIFYAGSTADSNAILVTEERSDMKYKITMQGDNAFVMQFSYVQENHTRSHWAAPEHYIRLSSKEFDVMAEKILGQHQ